MERLSASLLVCCWVAFGSILGEAATSYSFATQREAINLSERSATDTAALSSHLSNTLVWFANFSIGDAQDVKLYLSSGETDILLNPGVYDPSSNSKPYNNANGTNTFANQDENIGRSGLGYENFNGTVYTDTVSAGGLTFDKQAIGNVTSYHYTDIKPRPYAQPGDGIIGFSDASGSVFDPPAPSWFQNLVDAGRLAEPRYGTAFGTSGRGVLNIGTLATNLFSGSLVSVPRTPLAITSSAIQADIAVDDKIFFLNQTIILDVGTTNIDIPLRMAKKLFAKLGYQTSLMTDPATPYTFKTDNLLAYFDCANPPTVGLSIPAQSELNKGQNATIFNLEPSVWDFYRHSADPNNCTSIITGSNELTGFGLDVWLVGQPMFQGYYVDFDSKKPASVGFAKLIDPTMSS